MRIATFEVEIQVFMKDGQTLEEVKTQVSEYLVNMEAAVLDLTADINDERIVNHV